MSKLKELRDRRIAIANELTALLPLPGRKMSSEDRSKADRMLSEIDSLKTAIDGLESIASDDTSSRIESFDRESRKTRRPNEDPIGDEPPVASGAERSYRRAFGNFLRHGLLPRDRGSRGVSDEDRAILLARNSEFRDMGVGTGAGGGYVVPQGFVYDVESALKYYGPMLDAATIMDTTTGQPLPWPNSDDTTNTGEQIAENQQVATADVVLGSLTFNAWKYSTKLVKVSIELIQDSAFDLEKWLAKEFAIRLGRILNTKFTVGVGTTEPNGIVTAATLGATATGAAANTGGSDSDTNTIGSTDLIELEHSVDPLYRQGASYMMHDSTLKAMKEVLDKYGRPLWKPSVAAGAPDTINGYPYWINNDMATLAASAKTVLFGPFKKYIVRRVKNLTVLRLEERFADYGQVAFIGFARYDGNLLDAGTHPVKYLIQHS